MAEKNPALNCVTPKGRLSFPQLFEAKAFQKNEPKFSATILFDKKTDLADLKKAVKEAIKDKWGDQVPKGLSLPFKDGDEKDTEGYAGTVYVSASSKFKPQIVDQKREEILAHEDIYAGCFVRFSLTANAWELKEGKAILKRGVSFYLNAVQKLADGERMVKRKNASDIFGDVETDGSNDASNFEDEDDFLK